MSDGKRPDLRVSPPVYCPHCGLYMTNGFCLHGRIEERLESPFTARPIFSERRG